eukprot:2915759-Rhodomonas_salina.2
MIVKRESRSEDRHQRGDRRLETGDRRQKTGEREVQVRDLAWEGVTGRRPRLDRDSRQSFGQGVVYNVYFLSGLCVHRVLGLPPPPSKTLAQADVRCRCSCKALDDAAGHRAQSARRASRTPVLPSSCTGVTGMMMCHLEGDLILRRTRHHPACLPSSPVTGLRLPSQVMIATPTSSETCALGAARPWSATSQLSIRSKARGAGVIPGAPTVR